jgi:hypothetical protein
MYISNLNIMSLCTSPLCTFDSSYRLAFQCPKYTNKIHMSWTPTTTQPMHRLCTTFEHPYRLKFLFTPYHQNPYLLSLYNAIASRTHQQIGHITQKATRRRQTQQFEKASILAPSFFDIFPYFISDYICHLSRHNGKLVGQIPIFY